MKIRSKLEADQKMMQEITWLAEMMPKYILYTTSILLLAEPRRQPSNPHRPVAESIMEAHCREYSWGKRSLRVAMTCPTFLSS
jgi:hypothetical protein